MVSTLQLQEKYNKIRNNFCFYLDIQEPALCRSISRRLQDMGLQEEVFLTQRVTHVVLDHKTGISTPKWPRREGRARVDAMLERLRVQPPPKPAQQNYIQLTVQKAISLLDKLYDTFFTPRKVHVNYFSKHFIKIEFLDKPCRPVYKEFDEWPRISLEPDSLKEEKREVLDNTVAIPSNNNIAPKMTRKSRPRVKEREIKEEKGGYCEMCNVDYADATLHRRSPHHLAFVRDHANFLSLDSLITSGADVNTFLDKATPVNGERRSLRKICNGDVEPKKRSKHSQSPDGINGKISPKRNGGIEEEKKHNTRCSKKTSDSTQSEDRQYYKVVGVSTKLRSSGGFIKKKDPTLCNGAKPLVVKFRKVRRSELSVLSDEAEQFMFPKRASSSSSTSSDEAIVNTKTRKKQSPQLPPPERQRLARPIALKEESSEEDIWPDKQRRKRRVPSGIKRVRRRVIRKPPCKPPEPVEPDPPPPRVPEPEPDPDPRQEISPLRGEAEEQCMKWEDGRLKYTPAVEQLEFAFESVPQSEPWFETFKRQDQDKVVAKNVPQYFALYSKSPKLPYEIGQLPPLKPNCCPLSDLVKREEKPGPSRSYGTRGMKKKRITKRAAAIIAMESHPRKSPREHASTLAILGSAGLLHRRKNDDAKSTASEETLSDTHSKLEPVVSEAQETSERLQQFLSEVFEGSDYDVSEDVMENDIPTITSRVAPDVSNLVSECENCDIIQNEMKSTAKTRERRGKFKKKNRTGWPSKKNKKKGSRNSSMDEKEGLDRSLETLSETDENQTESEEKNTQELELPCPMDDHINSKNVIDNKSTTDKRSSDSEEKVEIKRKKRALQGLCDWLPVVRVARVDPNATRRLRSAGRGRLSKFR
ncbi:unnamed protein product [Leptosia nina]|uniref:DBF4-type domain-containing protein n=1 Tax=Leptosia nina TaxID=320188 RepID=A0AAV1JRT2_9NEOP